MFFILNFFPVFAALKKDSWIMKKIIEAINELTNPAGYIETAKPWLFITSGESKFASIWGTISNVYDSFAIYGGILLCLYFAMSVLEKLSREELSPQILTVSTVEFIIAFEIMIHGLDILEGFNAIAEQLVNEIQGLGIFANSESSKVDITTQILIDNGVYDQNGAIAKGFGKTDAFIFYFTKLFVPHLAGQILTVMILVQAITRGVEIVIYSCLAPLAIPNLFKDGSHSGGIRFLKKYFAITMQAGIMVIILLASQWLNVALLTGDSYQASSAGGYLGNCFYYCASGFVAVMLMSRAQQYANDIVGV